MKERLHYLPKTPECLKNLVNLNPIPIEKLPIDPKVEPLFPHLKTNDLVEFVVSSESLSQELRLGLVFSGGPAAGGHNVASGVFDSLQKINKKSALIGFLGGSSGILENRFCILDETKINEVRNQGGFYLLGTGRTKIETDEQLQKCKETCQYHQLDGLIVVGGDDSNTNATVIAEYFLANKCKTRVIGVPKTIDNDLKNQWIEASFGFDSASKTYSEIIGNLMSDAISQGKYYFFIKVMGRTASHLVLECALQTCPNLAFISEEKLTLDQVIDQICDLIIERKKIGKNYGVILIPEGLVEFIPDFKTMITDLKSDPHGNISLSKIETERLIITLVEKKLNDSEFSPQPFFVGYEGRCCYPSNFDCDYCYCLGMTATLLVAHKKTGYMAVVRHLYKENSLWTCQGIPLITMLHVADKAGVEIPIIKQNLVNLEGAPFQAFAARRKAYRLEDHYKNPGPIQFFGSNASTDRITETLKLESSS